jgi:3-oxoacyl-[acyl-carrier-protein] synthase-3
MFPRRTIVSDSKRTAAHAPTTDEFWIRSCAAYVPATRVTVYEAIGRDWYGDEEHTKDGYLSVAVEREWWPADMALATARTALDASGADGARLAQLSYASIHRHGNARLWQPAAYLQRVLKAPQALAFSLSHGCNGMFVAARLALDSLRDVAQGEERDALVVGADRFGTSSFDRWRGDYGVLYGDAAAAVLFGRAPGFARVRHLSIASVPELEGMHRHADEHIEDVGHAAHEFGVRASKKAFIERFGRERFFEAIGAALARLRDDVLGATDLGTRPADWLITPHLSRSITRPLYAGMFRGLAVRHYEEYGLTVGHTGTADPFVSLAALARSGQLERGQRVLLIDSGAGFSCGLMLLDAHDVSRAMQCGDLHSLLSDLER